MHDWINVEDRLPIQIPEGWPTLNWVLVLSKDMPLTISIARYNGDKWEFLDTNDSWTYGAMKGDCTNPIDIDNIGYWMPLPNPPEK